VLSIEATVDSETLDYLRSAVGEQLGIPSELRARLEGDTVAALRQDAKKMRRQLGLDERKRRGADGRFTGRRDEVNRWVRGG
jgi:hypothetical protein